MKILIVTFSKTSVVACLHVDGMPGFNKYSVGAIIQGFFEGETDFEACQRNFLMEGSLVPKLGVFEALSSVNFAETLCFHMTTKSKW